jgi:hypothetical protein
MSEFVFLDRLHHSAVYSVFPRCIGRLQADASSPIRYRPWPVSGPFTVVPAKGAATLGPGLYEITGHGFFKMTTGTVRRDVE